MQLRLPVHWTPAADNERFSRRSLSEAQGYSALGAYEARRLRLSSEQCSGACGIHPPVVSRWRARALTTMLLPRAPIASRYCACGLLMEWQAVCTTRLGSCFLFLALMRAGSGCRSGRQAMVRRSVGGRLLSRADARAAGCWSCRLLVRRPWACVYWMASTCLLGLLERQAILRRAWPVALHRLLWWLSGRQVLSATPRGCAHVITRTLLLWFCCPERHAFWTTPLGRAPVVSR